MIKAARYSFFVIPAFMGMLVPGGCTRHAPPAPFMASPENRSAKAGEIVFQKGDTLYLIAERYGVNIRDLIEANKLEPPYDVAPGTKLNLVAPRQYTVRKGETLSGIARLYRVSQTELVRMNKIPYPYIVEEGEVLRLPSQYADKPATIQAVSIQATPLAPQINASPVLQGTDKDQNRQDKIAASLPAPVSPAHVLRDPVLQQAPVIKAETPDMAGSAVTETPAAISAPSVQPVSANIAKTLKLESPPLSPGKFLMPVNGPVIADFGPKPDGSSNDGINIAAPAKTPVRVAENGIVAYVGNQLKGFGNLILVRHAEGIVTAYAHLDSVLVKRGDILSRGQTIGQVGKTGLVDRPQLHFEVRKASQPVNPKEYL